MSGPEATNELDLPPEVEGASIAGTVNDFQGVPLVGVRVEVAESGGADLDLLPVLTDGTGGFRVTGLAEVTRYDLRFSPLLRVPQAAGVEVLGVPAQWPDTRATHWRGLVVGRAVELQAFVVATNRTGIDQVGRRRLELAFPGNSLVVGPDGTVLVEGTGEPGLLVAEADPAAARLLRKQIPVQRDERSELYPGWNAAATRADAT